MAAKCRGALASSGCYTPGVTSQALALGPSSDTREPFAHLLSWEKGQSIGEERWGERLWGGGYHRWDLQSMPHRGHSGGNARTTRLCNSKEAQ